MILTIFPTKDTSNAKTSELHPPTTTTGARLSFAILFSELMRRESWTYLGYKRCCWCNQSTRDQSEKGGTMATAWGGQLNSLQD